MRHKIKHGFAWGAALLFMAFIAGAVGLVEISFSFGVLIWAISLGLLCFAVKLHQSS